MLRANSILIAAAALLASTALIVPTSGALAQGWAADGNVRIVA